jgi:hypothetical protein
MKNVPRWNRWACRVAAAVVGTLYAALLALLVGSLETALLAWPIWIGLAWLLFRKARLLRFAGILAALPISIFLMERYWAATHPGVVSDRYLAADRSHYRPNTRLTNPQTIPAIPDGLGWGVDEVFIAADGFRADPETGEGNPASCRYALVGDSMMYGSGLPYPQTLGPVLRGMGLEVCVFGVTGNSPVDYLATLRFVADRLEPGTAVAVYLYAYNDFVSLHKYYQRGFLSLANTFPRLFRWFADFDNWRQSSFLHNLVRGERAEPPPVLWEYPVGPGEPIRMWHPRDPAEYQPPRSLNARRRAALDRFLDELAGLAGARSWRVAVVIHPDYPELLAHLAQGRTEWEDLDPRRAEAAAMARARGFECIDLSRYLFERSVAESKNPFFINNRHFSEFGTRVVAEHFAAWALEP